MGLLDDAKDKLGGAGDALKGPTTGDGWATLDEGAATDPVLGGPVGDEAGVPPADDPEARGAS
jgi:hypothetical protein